MVLPDQVRGSLSDHDAGRVDVAARDFGHNAGIGDPQVPDPHDAKPFIHDIAHATIAFR